MGQYDKDIFIVTGGCGFVGFYLCKRLLENGATVLSIDNFSRNGSLERCERLGDIGGTKFYGYDQDIESSDMPEFCKAWDSEPTAIFHLAAQTAVTTSLTNPRLDFNSNLKGTFNLIDGLRKIDYRGPIILASSNKVYGDLTDFEMIEKEDTYECPDFDKKIKCFDPCTPYGVSKYAAMVYMFDYHKTFGMKTFTAVASCLAGAFQKGTYDQGWVSHLFNSIINKEPITICGSGKQVRDILFIDDMINFYIKAAIKVKNSEHYPLCCDVGGGFENRISVLQLIKMVENITGIKANISFTDWRSGDQKYYVSDNSRWHYFDWKPTINLETGIKQIIEGDTKNDRIIANI